ncbi:MAG: hypothetical protein ACLT98_10500 [Eggerthellaceae bacterium]
MRLADSLLKKAQEGVAEGMKSSMLSYMLDQCGNCQVIIVENEIRTMSIICCDPYRIHQNEGIGRYGFA